MSKDDIHKLIEYYGQPREQNLIDVDKVMFGTTNKLRVVRAKCLFEDDDFDYMVDGKEHVKKMYAAAYGYVPVCHCTECMKEHDQK